MFENVDSKRPIGIPCSINYYGGEVVLKNRAIVDLLVSAAFALAIVMISSLFNTPLFRMGIDVVRRGAPLPWIIQVILRAGQVIWSGFITDVVFWIVVIFAALTSVTHLYARKT